MQRTTDVLHNLTEGGAVTVTATELYTHSWRANNEKIRVDVSGTTLPVVVELYNADARTDLLATFTLNEGNPSNTFTNLTLARNYYIIAMGDRNAKLTVSDAS